MSLAFGFTFLLGEVGIHYKVSERMRESSVILTIHGDQGIMDYSLELKIGDPDENPHVSCAREKFQLRKSEVEIDRTS